MANNFRELGSKKGFLWSFVGGAGVVAAFALLALNLSDLPEGFPNHLVAIGIALAIGQIAASLQGEAISAHLAGGGIKQSGWKVTVLTVAWLGATLLSLVIFIVLFDS